MTIRIVDTDPAGAVARALMDALSAQLAAITGDDGRSHFSPDAPVDGAVFLVAYLDGAAAGCGALRPLGAGVGEIKRMYAAAPGRGIGSALLAALEARAQAAGYQALWLSTRRVNQAAVDFYLARGYRVRANYGPYIGRANSVCFEKAVASVGPYQHAGANEDHR